MTEKRAIHFVSLGCPKNRVDSEVMLGLSMGEGWTHVDDPAAAEVIVVNTCGFIGEAKKESIETIFEMAKMKDDGRCERLVVTGCLAQRHPDDIAREMPEVDHVLGSSDMMRLRDVLEGRAERVLVGAPSDWLVSADSPRVLSSRPGSAYVKIAEGCNRTCSFCVIPELRGKQRSRPIEDVVREVERLVDAGVLEVNLVSQDTVAYGRDLPNKPALAELVRRVAEVKGLAWLRLHYLYPETLDDALVELLAKHPRVLRYVDMPLQHAADAMLRRMRRGHGGARLRRVVERLRSEIPDLTFRTAFIVGHPGETEEEFTELVDFVKWAEFERVGVFQFSDEESARSFALEGKVPARTAAARVRKLMRVQRPIARRKNDALVGRELQVLVEGQSDEHELVMMGRHAGQAPDIDGQVYLSGGEATPGTLRTVTISQSSDHDLVGELDEGAAAKKPKATKKAGPVRLRVLATDGR
jgi:ribosomal protein S12 methylthiotransferase